VCVDLKNQGLVLLASQWVFVWAFSSVHAAVRKEEAPLNVCTESVAGIADKSEDSWSYYYFKSYIDRSHFHVFLETKRLLIGSTEPIDSPWNRFIVALKDSGQVIGGIRLNYLDPEAAAPLDFRPTFQKNGYGTEAKYALLKYAFEQLGVPEFSAYIKPDNVGSIKLHERLGFLLQTKGKNSNSYVLTRQHFFQKQKAIERVLQLKGIIPISIEAASPNESAPIPIQMFTH